MTHRTLSPEELAEGRRTISAQTLARRILAIAPFLYPAPCVEQEWEDLKKRMETLK